MGEVDALAVIDAGAPDTGGFELLGQFAMIRQRQIRWTGRAKRQGERRFPVRRLAGRFGVDANDVQFSERAVPPTYPDPSPRSGIESFRYSMGLSKDFLAKSRASAGARSAFVQKHTRFLCRTCPPHPPGRLGAPQRGISALGTPSRPAGGGGIRGSPAAQDTAPQCPVTNRSPLR